jgi:hypothetical protein
MKAAFYFNRIVPKRSVCHFHERWSGSNDLDKKNAPFRYHKIEVEKHPWAWTSLPKTENMPWYILHKIETLSSLGVYSIMGCLKKLCIMLYFIHNRNRVLTLLVYMEAIPDTLKHFICIKTLISVRVGLGLTRLGTVLSPNSSLYCHQSCYTGIFFTSEYLMKQHPTPP